MISQKRRYGLFAFGFLLGCILVYFMLIRGQDRSYWLPENRVKEQVRQSKVVFSDYARCMMKCRGISEEDVMHILSTGDVNFSESDIRDAICPSYSFDGTTRTGTEVRVVCTACDSIAHVSTAVNLEYDVDTCQCK